jgi:hypothetical protein
MQALLKLLDKTTIAHQTAVIEQWRINQRELKLYIRNPKHDDNSINQNDLLRIILNGEAILQQIEDGYYDNARGVLAENY